MLNGHIDTVGFGAMDDPLSATIRDGRMHGRGAYDMKCGVAACLGAAKAIVDAGAKLPGDLLVSKRHERDIKRFNVARSFVPPQYAV